MAKKKKFKVRPGTVLYMARHYNNDIDTIRVVSVSADGRITYVFPYRFGHMKDLRHTAYLQDLGMPGWKYDNRPIQLHRKLSDAHRIHPRAISWSQGMADYRYAPVYDNWDY